MQVIFFVLACIATYFGSDLVLRRAEKVNGKPFAHRELVFFFILLGLGFTSFYLIRKFVAI
jgi:hypothetical protein